MACERLETSGRKITNSAHHIDFFLHDILDYAVLKGKQQKFTTNIQIFDVKEAIEQVVDVQLDKANMKKINIEIEYQGLKTKVMQLSNGQSVVKFLAKTDKKRMQQVFMNLLTNSLKYTKNGGKIIVLVQNLQQKDQLNMSQQGQEDSDYLRISVKDNGQGIKR